VTGEAFPLETGLRVADTGGPIGIPLSTPAIRQVMASQRVTAPATETVATGIKSIDLLAPRPAGRVALVGDMQTARWCWSRS